VRKRRRGKYTITFKPSEIKRYAWKHHCILELRYMTYGYGSHFLAWQDVTMKIICLNTLWCLFGVHLCDQCPPLYQGHYRADGIDLARWSIFVKIISNSIDTKKILFSIEIRGLSEGCREEIGCAPS
jgi:hypothetical protein